MKNSAIMKNDNLSRLNSSTWDFESHICHLCLVLFGLASFWTYEKYLMCFCVSD